MSAHHKTSAIISALETHRAELIDYINRTTDALIASFSSVDAGSIDGFKIPTLLHGRDPRNKSGVNLTPRGVEILYRLFDDGAGYNRASKILDITINSARNRKEVWEKEGGRNRKRLILDIDEE